MSWRDISWRRPFLGLAMSLVVLAGCDIPGLLGASGGAYPDACESLGFGARQCGAIVARAGRDAGLDPAQITSTEILPPGEQPVSLGGQRIARVRFTLANGDSRTEDFRCVGVGHASDLACASDPRIAISGGVDHDVPCTGEAPKGCATPPPTPRPASVAAATPLRILTLDIPIDHLGHYELQVGTASLPDGVLSERSAQLADTQPTAFWIDDSVRLEVRPADPTRPPIGNIYRDPFVGVEPVMVFIVFDVSETSPGAVLQVRDLVIR